MNRFVLNVKDNGKCHLVSPGAMQLPRGKRRTVCGWRFGSAVSLASKASVRVGHVCLKCFPNGIIAEDGDVSPIEEYE